MNINDQIKECYKALGLLEKDRKNIYDTIRRLEEEKRNTQLQKPKIKKQPLSIAVGDVVRVKGARSPTKGISYLPGAYRKVIQLNEGTFTGHHVHIKRSGEIVMGEFVTTHMYDKVVEVTPYK